MSDKTNEDGIKAIAEALRAGGTLLSTACPVCDSPLIKIKDKIYCKVCNKEVMIYKDESELPKEIQRALHKNASSTTDSTESKVQQTINKKIETLRKRLEEAEDPDEIIKLSDAIDKLHSTLTKMRDEQ